VYVRQIVDKIGSILDLFTFDKSEWGVTEISRELDIPKSSVSELMTSMALQGLVERIPPGRYRLGWRWFSVNQVLLDSNALIKEGRSILHEMAERHGESCHLSVFERSEAVLIEKAQASLTTQILMSKVGTKLPLHASASGKLMLAFMQPADLEKAIPENGLMAYSPKTILSTEVLMRNIEGIRMTGVAVDNEEFVLGLSSIAAPVHNSHGKMIAALGFSMPAHRLAEQLEQFMLITKQCASRLSARLGFTTSGFR
jgi:IclR family transcriptional regulator, KDG regulon repressor